MERQSLTGSPANSKQARTRLSLAVALLAGCAIGAAVAGVVHAQATPPAFTIAEIDVIDPAEFQAFAKSNAAGVAAAGGHFLALHGRIVTEEGTPPKDIALIAWGTLDQATAYFSSPTFQALIPQRDRGANVRLFHVEGLPQ
jgi:uncharacterized protein (DUF1330 family)